METKIVYNYEHKDDIQTDLLYKLLNKLYSLSYPKPNLDFETMAKVSHTLSNQKWKYPIDFYYMPQEVQREIINDFLEKHNIEFYWKSNMDFLIDILFNKGGIKEVYSTDEHNDKPYRHCIDVEILEKQIPKEYSDKVKEILKGYADTYKFGSRDYNSLNLSAYNYSPNINRNNVISAWKEVFNKDIEIPSDNVWIDEYTDVEDD